MIQIMMDKIDKSQIGENIEILDLKKTTYFSLANMNKKLKL